MTGTILVVLGALMVLLAIKQWLGSPDPDAAPPKVMTALDSMSPAKATLLGLVSAVLNVKQLGIFVGGVAQIVHADLPTAQAWWALVLLVVLIQIGALGAVLGYVVAREATTRQLERLRGWLVSHNRVVGIVLGLVVGALFTLKGLAQLP